MIWRCSLGDFKRRLTSELDRRVKEGFELLEDLTKEEPNLFRANYQHWYTRALGAVRELSKDRLHEFTLLYQVDKRKQLGVDAYGIHDFMLGLTFFHYSEPANEKGIALSAANINCAICSVSAR